MKKAFLDFQGLDVKLVSTFMRSYNEFGKLDNETQKVLIWLALNHHDTIGAFAGSLSEVYSTRDIQINVAELLHDIEEALIFLDSAPTKIRYILNSSARQKMFESISDFENGTFSVYDLSDHLKERELQIDVKDIARFLRALTHHGFLTVVPVSENRRMIKYYQRL